MLKKIYLSLIFLSFSSLSIASWTDLNTGINDNLTGVVMWLNNGVVTGNQGVYYTTTGGSGPASWTRFNITGNTADSILYNNTSFNHCFAYSTHTDLAMACGQDTVNNRAVIMEFNLPAMTYTMRYLGTVGSSLNGIGYSGFSNNYFAVGDNGLIVRFSTSSNGVIVSTGLTQDLQNIDFRSNKFSIACYEYRILGTDITSSLQIDLNVYQPGFLMEDVMYNSATRVLATGDIFEHINVPNGAPTIYSYYNYGPLNAKGCAMRGTNFVVVTDHGAFFATQASNYTILQWEPSSMNYAFNDIWTYVPYSETYACGPNGLVMYSGGEVGFPYGAINGDAATCLNSTEIFSEIASTGSTTNFYLDGAFATSSPNLVTTFTTPGTHEVMLLTTANSMVDTAIILVEVYEQPVVDFSFSVLDTILCHKEPLEITLDTTEQYVAYWLYNSLFTQNFGVSSTGTGDTLVFNTDSLSSTGTYFLRAEHTLGNCMVNFTIPIELTVEQTKAKYHSTFINAATGEQVLIMENCVDADNFAWTFTPSANPVTSSLADPTVAFGNPGTTTVDLTCWSNNFCYDSIVGPGPYIFTPPVVTDSCWNNEMRGTQPAWPGFYIDDMADLHNVNDGYLLTGSYSADTLESQHGINALIHKNGTFAESRGGFMAKFDYDGTVKWVVHDRSNGSIQINKGLISDAEKDSQGNIYICGHGLYRFFDNAGDSVQITGSYLMKLDSLGRYLWHTRITGPNGTYTLRKNMYLAIDQDDYIYWGGMEADYYVEADGNVVMTNTNGSYNLKVMKIAPNGDYLWHTGISTNGEMEELEVDNNKNIYTAGKYASAISIYSNGSPTIAYTTSGSTISKTFVAKWDSTGQFLYCSRITLSGQNGGGNYYQQLTYPRDLYVDPSTGEAYVTGRTHFGYLSNRFFVTNTAGISDTLGFGGLYLVKFQPNGDLEWAVGTDMITSGALGTAAYGCGEEVFVENDTVYLAGVIHIDTTNLSSVGSTMSMSGNQNDFFVARLTTSGILMDALKSGDNLYNINAQEPTIEGLFRNEGAYFASRNATVYSGSEPIEFGDTLTSPAAVGWVDKFYEPCGTLYYPEFNTYDVVSICQGASYTFPDGYIETNITTSISHISYLTSIYGYDSTVFTTLNVENYAITAYESVCYGGSYTLPNGNLLTNITSNYADTTFLSSAQGCDSLIILNLIVINSSTGTDIQTACDSYTWMDGNTYTSSTNVPTWTLLNQAGCDSVVTLDLTITNSNTGTDLVSACDSYTWFDGNTYTSSTNTPTWILTNQAGCDSLVTLDLTINIVNTAITQIDDTTLQANAIGAQYQWLDCNNSYAQLNGETGQSYAASSNGSYAVEIMENGCVDTSACLPIAAIGIIESEILGLTVSPNPTDGHVVVHLGNQYGQVSIQVFDMMGRLIQKQAFTSTSKESPLFGHPPGSYTMEIIADTKRAVVRIIKQ